MQITFSCLLTFFILEDNTQLTCNLKKKKPRTGWPYHFYARDQCLAYFSYKYGIKVLLSKDF